MANGNEAGELEFMGEPGHPFSGPQVSRGGGEGRGGEGGLYHPVAYGYLWCTCTHTSIITTIISVVQMSSPSLLDGQYSSRSSSPNSEKTKKLSTSSQVCARVCMCVHVCVCVCTCVFVCVCGLCV